LLAELAGTHADAEQTHRAPAFPRAQLASRSIAHRRPGGGARAAVEDVGHAVAIRIRVREAPYCPGKIVTALAGQGSRQPGTSSPSVSTSDTPHLHTPGKRFVASSGHRSALSLSEPPQAMSAQQRARHSPAAGKFLFGALRAPRLEQAPPPENSALGFAATDLSGNSLSADKFGQRVRRKKSPARQLASGRDHFKIPPQPLFLQRPFCPKFPRPHFWGFFIAGGLIRNG